MIKKLQKKIIACAMCSMAFVLAAIIIGINIAGYANVCKNADMRIRLIAENNGKFPQYSKQPKKNVPYSNRDISPESAFDTRFFTVTLSEKGTILRLDTGKIAAIDSEEAAGYAATLYAKKRTHGFIDCYRYQMFQNENSILYIFVNTERELVTFRMSLFASIGISLLGLLLVFLMVTILSGMLVKPAAESYEKQKRFITDASHEIKTPLTIIDANTEVLEMTGGENQWTKSIRNQIGRLTALTEKLVFLSRMDEEGTKLEMADFPISDAVLDTAEPFLPLAETRGKKLTIDVQPALSYHGNEGTIRQMVSLLLDNAVKYSTENGEIRLSFHNHGKNLLLTLWNTTDDMQPGRHTELFDRFYRPDASRNSKTGGHGIGLSVVQAIVMAHKGKITAESQDGKSLTISVILIPDKV